MEVKIDNSDERTRRKKNYGCEFRTKHRVSQLLVEFYCTLDHEKCEYQPSRCPKRKRALALEKHKPITSFFW